MKYYRRQSKTFRVLLCLCLMGCLSSGLIACQSSPEKKKLKHYNKGIEYVQEGELQSAILEFKNAIEAVPEFADAHYQLGLAYLQLREHDKAVIAFDNAASHDPENLEARLQVANYYYLRQQDLEKARKELEGVLQDFPESAEAHSALGSIHLVEERLDEAVVSFTKSLELAPSFAEAGTKLGRLYLQRGEFEKAGELFKGLLDENSQDVEVLTAAATFFLETGEIEEAQTLYKKAIALEPERSTAYLGLAEAFLMQRSPENALEALENLKENASEDLPQAISLRVRFIAGRAYLFQKNYQEAVSELQVVAERLPRLMMGQYSYGLAQSGVGKFEQAIAAYLRALQLDEQHLPTRFNLAIAYFKSGNLEDAYATVGDVLEIAPDHVEALDLYGMVLTRLGRNQEALEQFLRAETLLSDVDGASQASLKLKQHKASALLRMNEAEQAIVELESVIEGGIETAEVYVQLAKAYALLGNRWEDAVAACRQAIDLDAEFWVAHIELAKLYLSVSQYEQARESLDPVLSQRDENPDVLYVLGRIAAGEGRLEEAKETLQQALQMRTGFVDASYALAGVFQALQDSERAIREYERVLESFPEHFPSLLNLAYMKLQQGSYEEAASYAERALRLDAENINALDILSSVYAQNRQFEKAIGIIETARALYPDSPTSYLNLGLLLVNQGKFDEAIDAAQQALERDPENVIGYNILGNAYLGKGDDVSAEQTFRNLLELDPEFVAAYVKLGQVALTRKKFSEAMPFFERALEYQPDYAGALLELGKLYRAQKRYEQAIELFEKIPESSVYFQYALEPLIQIYNNRGDYNKVISLSSKLLKRYPDNSPVRYALAQAYAKRGDIDNAVEMFREISLASPDLTKAFVELGVLYLVQNRFESALTEFEEALRQGPELNALLGKALAFQMLQNYQEAVNTAKSALELEPNNQLAHFLLANIYISQKSFSDAIEQFQQMTIVVLESFLNELKLRSYYGDQSSVAAAYYNLGMLCVPRQWYDFAKSAYKTALWRTPDNPLLYYARGNLLLADQQVQGAEEDFKDALKLAPELSYVHKTMAEMYQRQGKTKEAVDSYQRYLEKAPEDVRSRLKLGMLRESLGAADDAIAEYLAILEQAPDNPIVQNQLAWLYAEQEIKLDDALSLAQKAVSLSPSAGIIDTLGWVLYKREQYPEAIEQFKLALEKMPHQPMISYHLGLAYYANEEFEAAKNAFEKVLQRSKDFEFAEKIQEMLEDIRHRQS